MIDFDRIEKMSHNELKRAELKMLQSLPLDIKIEKSKLRIHEWYDYFHGRVYVSFSGGKDSTVLLHLVRSLYPEVPAVFVDTGLEYPEIRDFVKATENVTWLKPKMNFREIIEKYGYPVISKEQSGYIEEYRNTKSDYLRNIRVNGTKWGLGKISKKWFFLTEAPFKISNKCCTYIKKQPIYIYEKENDRKPFIGNMAAESLMRQQQWVMNSCNAFNLKRPTSTPIAFWKEEDIWAYLREFNVPYSTIYNMGCDRTGCMFCAFGCHMDKDKKNKFELMKDTHPQQYKYCMEKLGLDEVLTFCGIKH
jgi:3'-phosphoadenosine 5'-phosphosulfate sulfotransferase (PAPS reductase)/FAD synthetase